MIHQVECSSIIEHAREIVKENKLDNGELYCSNLWELLHGHNAAGGHILQTVIVVFNVGGMSNIENA